MPNLYISQDIIDFDHDSLDNWKKWKFTDINNFIFNK
jgi:hypothetical protein